MKDVNPKAIHIGYRSAFRMYDYLVKTRKVSLGQRTIKMLQIQGVLDYRGFKTLDIVVEAVVESLTIKQSVLAELELHLDDKAIMVSNTSSLSINELAKDLKKPHRFAGMHFFNPVNRMPLVEIVAGAKTSMDTIERLVHLTRKLGKTPIVVKDCAGFLVNRLLLPYMNEAGFLLEEGASVEKIDDTLKSFGFPMGPFMLLDEVGIDVGYKVATVLSDTYGERMEVNRLLTDLVAEVAGKKYLGKKNGNGFYQYQGKKIKINAQFKIFLRQYRKRLASHKRKSLSKQHLLDRCLLIMINEAARCLEEKIVTRVQHLDMAMILGTGFPPFRGGLLRYADSLGVVKIVEKLKALEQQCGKRYTCAPLLVEMARDGLSFY